VLIQIKRGLIVIGAGCRSRAPYGACVCWTRRRR